MVGSALTNNTKTVAANVNTHGGALHTLPRCSLTGCAACSYDDMPMFSLVGVGLRRPQRWVNRGGRGGCWPPTLPIQGDTKPWILIPSPITQHIHTSVCICLIYM
ncbi:hypothetical protein PV327_000104 [Microctonus hyperodae]|uniref:Uncharacterized protein n=1 Tax=Microctonus hyperodae TaxID=165561 RepID=A0AA39G763_MICHY|nr:hypothetical protein PV327_000104 [Microctonus hyperodae]